MHDEGRQRAIAYIPPPEDAIHTCACVMTVGLLECLCMKEVCWYAKDELNESHTCIEINVKVQAALLKPEYLEVARP